MAGDERRRREERRKKGRLRLIVEGPDDKHAIISLVARHGIDWDADALALPFVEDATGVDSLLQGLPTAASAPYDRLGIVADMDDPRDQDRWAQIQGRLRSKGVVVPDAPSPEGTIFPGLQGASSRIGVWLMPDNRSGGVLEHFLSTLIPAGDPCASHAQEVTTRARELGAPLAEKDHAKGVIHTWLAWQADPGVPFGVALTKRYLRGDSPDAVRFVTWFKRLFLEPTKAAVPARDDAG